MLLGEFAIYLVGVLWLKIDLGVGMRSAISLGFTPFLIGDAIKLCIAASALPGAWAIVNHKASDDGW